MASGEASHPLLQIPKFGPTNKRGGEGMEDDPAQSPSSQTSQPPTQSQHSQTSQPAGARRPRGRQSPNYSSDEVAHLLDVVEQVRPGWPFLGAGRGSLPCLAQLLNRPMWWVGGGGVTASSYCSVQSGRKRGSPCTTFTRHGRRGSSLRNILATSTLFVKSTTSLFEIRGPPEIPIALRSALPSPPTQPKPFI